MTKPILIPDLSCIIEVANPHTLEELAQQIGSVLGISFGEDFEGLFEEANALVSHVLGHTACIFKESVEIGIGDTSQRVTFELARSFQPVDYGLTLNECEFVRVPTADYLASLLHKQISLSLNIRPPIIPIDLSQPSDQQKKVPRLMARLETDTTLSINQITARVGAALGVRFGSIAQVERNEPYAGWFSRKAHVLGHCISIFVASGPYARPLPRRVIFDLQSNFRVEGIDMSQYDIVAFNISEYIAAVLRKETDLIFRTLPVEFLHKKQRF